MVMLGQEAMSEIGGDYYLMTYVLLFGKQWGNYSVLLLDFDTKTYFLGVFWCVSFDSHLHFLGKSIFEEMNK